MGCGFSTQAKQDQHTVKKDQVEQKQHVVQHQGGGGGDQEKQTEKSRDDEGNLPEKKKKAEKDNLLGSKLRKDHKNSKDGSMQVPLEVSSSQINFFKMLDEKIENGVAFDEAKEDEIRQEELRKSVEEWDQVLSRSLDLRSTATISSNPASALNDDKESECLRPDQQDSQDNVVRDLASATSTKTVKSLQLEEDPPTESKCDADQISNASSSIVQDIKFYMSQMQ